MDDITIEAMSHALKVIRAWYGSTPAACGVIAIRNELVIHADHEDIGCIQWTGTDVTARDAARYLTAWMRDLQRAEARLWRKLRD